MSRNPSGSPRARARARWSEKDEHEPTHESSGWADCLDLLPRRSPRPEPIVHPITKVVDRQVSPGKALNLIMPCLRRVVPFGGFVRRREVSIRDYGLIRCKEQLELLLLVYRI